MDIAFLCTVYHYPTWLFLKGFIEKFSAPFLAKLRTVSSIAAVPYKGNTVHMSRESWFDDTFRMKHKLGKLAILARKLDYSMPPSFLC
jgi:hypothetical protein